MFVLDILPCFKCDNNKMTSIVAAKAALRKEVKTIIDLLSVEEKCRQSKIVQEKLFENAIYKQSKRISLFLNMDDEIVTEPILMNALESEKACYIPRYDSKSNHMDMVRLKSWNEYVSLPVTKWNIKQPSLSQECEEALSSGGLDLILVPGLAFTSQGHRMGRGRGYYDTYLAKCKAAMPSMPHTIALAFKEQLLSHIPTDDKDMVIDVVLTA
ncbi:5-formyltetrahydrofolate cyclo-ligase-like isoform X1 [Macrobrachium nipponense]|uniref:5-formyltetrahydrofolate cyclo-ligase-like isoform X1 n=2 Tax=Macrobrachium nipponense TaxID=159736 RepID=UPI0030C8BF27